MLVNLSDRREFPSVSNNEPTATMKPYRSRQAGLDRERRCCFPRHGSMTLPRHELQLPDLGLGEARVLASVWLVDSLASVTIGDRLLEVLCGDVTVDLPAPVSGRLVRQLVEEGESLSVGQSLGVIEEENEEGRQDDLEEEDSDS
ncbi:MAG: hypothetical protein N2C14_11840 [Planctomycetales bacterium]